VKEKLNTVLNNEALMFWLFVAPALFGIVVFILVPIVASFVLSFCKWDLLSKPYFIGFENYINLFSDAKFWYILKNTVVFALSVTFFALVIPLVLAAYMNSKIRGSELFKTIYFLPFVTPMIVIAIVWEWMFDPNIGLINYLFRLNLQWLYNETTAMLAIIIVSVWKLIGYNMVLFLSGFALIDDTLYESAKIDGASGMKSFFKITLPLLSPTIFFVLVITVISSFQVFDLIYLMTKGGPEDATNILVYWLYKNAFEYFNIGAASAIAYVLFVIIFVLTAIQWHIRKKWVYIEADTQ